MHIRNEPKRKRSSTRRLLHQSNLNSSVAKRKKEWPLLMYIWTGVGLAYVWKQITVPFGLVLMNPRTELVFGNAQNQTCQRNGKKSLSAPSDQDSLFSLEERCVLISKELNWLRLKMQSNNTFHHLMTEKLFDNKENLPK